jgi:dienelactone hydrolase
MRIVQLFALAILLPCSAIAQQKVSFQTENFKTWSDYFADKPSDRPTIDGVLTLPPGNGQVPAVIVMHGGTGITPAETDAAKTLVSAGFAAFVVDRATGRNILIGPGKPLRIHIASQLADGMNALRALTEQPRVDPARIGMLGFSQGGEITLALESKVLEGPYAALGQHYAAFVGVYPVCLLTSEGMGTSTDAPTLLLVGGKDRAATAASCRAVVALHQQTKTGSNIRIVEYPDAEHGWANSDIQGSAYANGMPVLTDCPIVAADASHHFFTFAGGKLDPVDRDVYPPPVFRQCVGHGVPVAYSAQTAAQSTAAWTDFFKANLMH